MMGGARDAVQLLVAAIRDGVQQVVVGKSETIELAIAAMRARLCLNRGCAGNRQDDPSKSPGGEHVLRFHAHTIHPRPGARQRAGHQFFRYEQAGVRVPPRAGVRPSAVGGWDQPGNAQKTIRVTGGDAGTLGLHRRRNHGAAGVVLRDRNPEPGGDGGHLSSARSAA